MSESPYVAMRSAAEAPPEFPSMADFAAVGTTLSLVAPLPHDAEAMARLAGVSEHAARTVLEALRHAGYVAIVDLCGHALYYTKGAP